MDGEVTVHLVDEIGTVGGSLIPACEQEMDAREGFIAVETAEGQVLMEHPLSSEVVRVRVWVSDLEEPEDVVVELLIPGPAASGT